MSRIVSVVAVALLAATTLALGQQRTLMLQDASRLALERNLNVMQAENNVASAQSGVLAAYGSYLPTLSATGRFSRYQNERPASQPVFVNGIPIAAGSSGRSLQNQFDTGVNLNYVVFDGFGREGAFGRAKSTAVSTEQQFSRTRQGIVYQVESSYLNVLRSEQLVKVNEENLKRDNRQLERIMESNKVGSASLADVYRQQSQVATDELSLITAQNNYDKAKADLLALIGLDAQDDFLIADSTISTQVTKAELDSVAAIVASIGSLKQRALVARPDYQSAQAQLSAAESGVTAARAGYFPSVSAFAGYSLSNNEWATLKDNTTLSWGLSLRWNIFDGFQTNQSIQTAQASRRNAEISLAQAERNISVDVKKALLDLDAARKQYEVGQKGLISASEDHKIAEERYNLGAGTLLDLLVASANLVNAQANQVNASYNYIIARKNVEYVLGERTY